ncbi:hypothetical protein F4818DRAFT_221218 [Hypoxylon cercidicola]|nr:hypothetical protein F4818DRAFT_221218 [Hypoxylon cercidicola]
MTSLYDLVVVTPTRILQTEVTILEKTEAWAKENGVSMADLVGARIYEDMLPMSMQIVITAMFARKAVELLSGKDVEPKEYRNYDLEGCRSLLSETLSLLAEVKPESVNGKETEVIEFGVGKRTAKAPAAEW